MLFHDIFLVSLLLTLDMSFPNRVASNQGERPLQPLTKHKKLLHGKFWNSFIVDEKETRMASIL